MTILSLVFGLLVALTYKVTGHVRPDQLLRCGVYASIAYLPFMIRRLAGKPGAALWTWPTGDVFTLADLCQSILILGRIGSGKTSSSGKTIARHIVKMNSGGIIFASNPDDKEMWEGIFVDANRSADLIYFGPGSKERWNLTASLQGADALELTDFFVQLSECLVEEKRPEDVYWKSMSERLLENSIRLLLMTGEPVSAPNITRIIQSAAYSADAVHSEQFSKGYCGGLVAKVGDSYDAKYVGAYFLREFPKIPDKSRGTAINAVTNLTHRLSIGIGRDIFSTTTTHSNKDIAEGKWILLDYPISAGGPTSKVVYTAAKLIVEKQVLKNNYKPGDPITCLWSDESPHILTKNDGVFLAEARKHAGVLVYLAQGIEQFSVALGAGNDKAKADVLLNNFGTIITHVCSMTSAEYMSNRNGKSMQPVYGGQQEGNADLFDQVTGTGRWTGNVRMEERPNVDPATYLVGRTGGLENKLICDSKVFRSGKPFKNGKQTIAVPWSQK